MEAQEMLRAWLRALTPRTEKLARRLVAAEPFDLLQGTAGAAAEV